MKNEKMDDVQGMLEKALELIPVLLVDANQRYYAKNTDGTVEPIDANDLMKGIGIARELVDKAHTEMKEYPRARRGEGQQNSAGDTE